METMTIKWAGIEPVVAEVVVQPGETITVTKEWYDKVSQLPDVMECIQVQLDIEQGT